MAEAILGGIIDSKVAKTNQVFTHARRDERRKELEDKFDVNMV